MFRPGMRAYLVPLIAGAALAVSAFLPWVVIDTIALRGVPDMAAIWVAGLGAVAVLLATASLITRRNSRHPLLLVGLVALGITFLSWRIAPQTIGARARLRSQAIAIVENQPMQPPPPIRVGSGIYVGLVSSLAIVLFGLTIVIRRASQPYVVAAADDDVD